MVMATIGRTYPVGTLQRAIVEEAARVSTGIQVDARDLNDGHRFTRALPYVVVTPALRKKRKWGP
jgi:hypothetical protein